MGTTQYGTEKHTLKRVRFIPQSSTDTLRVGYAVCYKYDAVDNLDGITASPIAEGSQNMNSRFSEVEKPDANNLQFFAGVVDESSDGAVTGDWITIVVPSAMTVPVWTDLSVTNGLTLLAIKAASYFFTNPVYGGSTTSARVVGIAQETIDRSGTNGLTWAKIGEYAGGLQQGFGVSTNLAVGVGVSAGDVIPNWLSLETLQTGGNFHAARLRGELAGAGAGTGEGGGVFRFEGIVNSTLITRTSALSGHLIFKTLATNVADETYEAGYFKTENQDGTPAVLTSAIVSVLRLVTQLNEDPGEHTIFRIESEGSDTPDTLFSFKSEAAGAISDATGETLTPTRKIAINVAGTTLVIHAGTSV